MRRRLRHIFVRRPRPQKQLSLSLVLSLSVSFWSLNFTFPPRCSVSAWVLQALVSHTRDSKHRQKKTERRKSLIFTRETRSMRSHLYQNHQPRNTHTHRLGSIASLTSGTSPSNNIAAGVQREISGANSGRAPDTQ